MVKLTKDQAMKLSVGERVLVRINENKDVRLGVISTINTETTSLEEFHNKLGIMYETSGFDIVEEMFDVPWYNGKDQYADIYLLSEGEL